MSDREVGEHPADGDGGSVFDGPPREAPDEGDRTPDRKRLAMIVAMIAVVLLLAGWGLWAAFGDADEDEPTGSLEATTERTVPATAASEATSGVVTKTPSADDTRTDHPDGDDPDDDGDKSDEPVDAGMVAFRKDGQVWVVMEDGAQARPVVPLPEGEYALSRDGTLLAIVDSPRATLRLVEVEGGRETTVGLAASERPVWARDSAWLAYTSASAHGYKAWSTSRDGSDAAALYAGHSPAISLDGERIAFVTESPLGEAGPLVVGKRTGAFDPIDGADTVNEAVWGSEGLFYVCPCGEAGASTIRRGSVDAFEGEEIVGPPTIVGKPVRYSSLLVSPDGDWLVYTEAGDDGYSRMFAVRTNGTGRRGLSVRRDDYPLRWTSDGERVLFIEGNSFQGEETRLMSVRPDGTGRVELVSGAGL